MLIDNGDDPILIVIRSVVGAVPGPPSLRSLRCSTAYFTAFGELVKPNNKLKWHVSMAVSDLLDDPTVLIEGVLFRARYLGSTQLACEGQPTKSTRMCQAEEAVSRIKVRLFLLFSLSYFSINPRANGQESQPWKLSFFVIMKCVVFAREGFLPEL